MWSGCFNKKMKQTAVDCLHTTVTGTKSNYLLIKNKITNRPKRVKRIHFVFNPMFAITCLDILKEKKRLL